MVEIERDNTRGIAVGGLTTGVIGTALGALNSGIIPGLFGNGAAAACSENMGVNRYELSMQRELTNKDMEIAYLRGRDAAKSDSLELYKYVDGKFACIEHQLADQRVYNATNTAALSCLTNQVNGIQTLMGSITRTTVPNSAICPGWGDVTVSVTPTTTTGAYHRNNHRGRITAPQLKRGGRVWLPFPKSSEALLHSLITK